MLCFLAVASAGRTIGGASPQSSPTCRAAVSDPTTAARVPDASTVHPTFSLYRYYILSFYIRSISEHVLTTAISYAAPDNQDQPSLTSPTSTSYDESSYNGSHGLQRRSRRRDNCPRHAGRARIPPQTRRLPPPVSSRGPRLRRSVHPGTGFGGPEAGGVVRGGEHAGVCIGESEPAFGDGFGVGRGRWGGCWTGSRADDNPPRNQHPPQRPPPPRPHRFTSPRHRARVGRNRRLTQLPLPPNEPVHRTIDGFQSPETPPPGPSRIPRRPRPAPQLRRPRPLRQCIAPHQRANARRHRLRRRRGMAPVRQPLARAWGYRRSGETDARRGCC
ncbi:hypothetical protein M8818_002835 [Zalaria obscura]|uniref:Uncharacterized protein n=1 Tax=Zalaria obscura TaxID=2024903 RepID=A0ACC3SH20_9PEZI